MLFLTLCCSVAVLSAQTTAQEWLRRLDSTLGTRYAMHLTVSVDEDEPLNGYFMVEGDAYYLVLGSMEVYSDGKLRYEVNNQRKEVTEDRVNLESVDLLSNPTRAFKFVDSEFQMSVASAEPASVVLQLVPKVEGMGISDISLTLGVDTQSVLPRCVVYNYDGTSVTIELSMADLSDSTLPRWSKQAYRAYDIVSFL